MKYKQKQNNKIYIIGAFLFSIFPKLVVAVNSFPVVDIVDETAAISTAAYLAGNDWTKVVSHSGYYGFGYYFIFAPLFRTSLSILTIYQIINIVTVFFTGLIPIISYYMIERYFKIYDQKVNMLLSVLCSYVTVVPVDRILNDHILIVLIWLIALVLCKLAEEEISIKFKYSCFLAGIISYSLTIHTRAILILFSVVIGIALYKVVYRKNLVSKIFFIILIICAVLSRLLINCVQKYVWLADDASKLTNASVSIPSSINWFSSDVWVVYGKIMLGMLGSFSIYGFIIGIILCIYLMKFVLLKIYSSIRYKLNDEIESGERYSFILGVVFGICCLGTIFAQGFIWLPGVLEGIRTNQVVYSYKVFSYLRYFIAYVGPIFLGGIFSIRKYGIKWLTVLGVSICGLVWIREIIPYLEKNSAGTSPYFSFAWASGQNLNNKFDNSMYFAATHFAYLMLLIFMVCYIKRNWRIYLLIVCVLMIYRYCYFSFNFSIPTAKEQYKEIELSLEYIKEYIKDSGSELYVYDKNMRLQSLYQIYLRDYEIVPYDLAKENPSIIFSNSELQFKNENKYKQIVLEKNQYVYIKDN